MLKKFVILVFCAAFVVGLNCADEVGVENEINLEGMEQVVEVEELQEEQIEKIDEVQEEVDQSNEELNPEILESYEEEVEDFGQEIFEKISEDDLNLLTDKNTSWEHKLNITYKYARVWVGGHLTKHQEKYLTSIATTIVVLGVVYFWSKKSRVKHN